MNVSEHPEPSADDFALLHARSNWFSTQGAPSTPAAVQDAPREWAGLFDAVLPPDGLRCVVLIDMTKTSPPSHYWSDDHDLNGIIETHRDDPRRDVFFAVATFTRQSRTQACVRAVRAFWLDVDVGAGKDYIDRAQARAAIKAFLRATGLPKPWVVSSGRGYHLYWPLPEAVELSHWKPLAAKLKEACVREGFRADPARTTDGASLLRVPGTTHHKDPAQTLPVRVVHEGTPVDVLKFSAVLNQYGPTAAPRSDASRAEYDAEMSAAPPSAPEADVRAAMAVLPPDDSELAPGWFAGIAPYERWFQVGLALARWGHDTGKVDVAFTLWHAWSARSSKYAGEEDCRQKWKSLVSCGENGGNSRTMLSVFKITNRSAEQREIITVTTPEAPLPLALPDGLAPVPAFAPELLPEAVRPWIMDIADRVSCPPDFVAIPAMLALVTALGRKVGIRPQSRTDWMVVPNLWGLIVGRPGAMKSPAMAQATAPLKRLAARAQDEHRIASAQWVLDEKATKLRAEVGEKEARKLLTKTPTADVSRLLAVTHSDDEPTLRRYTTSNATPEALGELLRQNPQGLMLERDEIMGLLRTLDRDENADHRAFLLEAWDGSGSFTFDRIGRGFNLHVPAMALSVCGTTQPGRLQAYLSAALSGGAADDGLMQRFSLLVWPDSSGEWRNVDRWPDGDAKRQALAAFDRLDNLDWRAIGAQQDASPNGDPEGLPYLRLDEAAHELFLGWRTETEARLRSGDLLPAFESHLAKYRKLVPALALVNHLADGQVGGVAAPAMLKALAWAQYLEAHAHRAYGSAQDPEVATAKAILSRIKRGDLPRTGFGSRDVWRPQWAALKDRDAVTKALSYLVGMGWLIEAKRSTDGRTATIYTLNAKAAL